MLMPGIPARVSAPTPEAAALATDTLSAKLNRRRLEKGQRQIDAAREMGVDMHSVINWERGAKEPMVAQYPTIISYLGYKPWPAPATLQERLRAERRRRGLPIKRAVRELGVDKGTLANWERGRTPSRHSTRCATGSLVIGEAGTGPKWSDRAEAAGAAPFSNYIRSGHNRLSTTVAGLGLHVFEDLSGEGQHGPIRRNAPHGAGHGSNRGIRRRLAGSGAAVRLRSGHASGGARGVRPLQHRLEDAGSGTR